VSDPDARPFPSAKLTPIGSYSHAARWKEQYGSKLISGVGYRVDNQDRPPSSFAYRTPNEFARFAGLCLDNDSIRMKSVLNRAALPHAP
jgi:hypothetical protein